MINAEIIKQKALEYGAAAVGIGDIRLFEGVEMQRDPLKILPDAKCIIGFLFRVPRALYRTMTEHTQYMQYTQIGVKYIDEDLSEIFLLKMGALIENEGYDACLQRNVSNLRIQGDHTTNPELVDTYELVNAEAGAPGKPAPVPISITESASPETSPGKTFTRHRLSSQCLTHTSSYSVIAVRFITRFVSTIIS